MSDKHRGMHQNLLCLNVKGQCYGMCKTISGNRFNGRPTLVVAFRCLSCLCFIDT